MLKSIQERDLKRNRWIKISMGVILGIICVTMVLTLIPGLNTGSANTSNTDVVATVAGQDITGSDLRKQIDESARGQQIPPMMRGILARQVLDQVIFQDAVNAEAARLGFQVTPQEEVQRIRENVPQAWENGVWNKDLYAQMIESNGMSVDQSESNLHESMLQEKVFRLVTDGITVSPAEIAAEFRRRNEKVAIQYSLINPASLASAIHPAAAELETWFSKNSSRYQIPEKRSVQYALLDLSQLRAHTQVSDDALRAYYNQHLDEYKVQNSAHLEHILLRTMGKTDAEVAETRQKAGALVKQARSGANFEDLAKKNSEDENTKSKGGDLGWIVDGQMLPQVQQAAFALPQGGVTDPIQTPYGFEIVKLLDHQQARTKSFDEVRQSILPAVLDEKVNAQADDTANQLAAAIRQSSRQPLDALAKKFDLRIGDVAPVTFNEPIGPLGNSQDLVQAVFQMTPGELSDPIRVAGGIAVVSVKEIFRAHQATLAEVHDRALADYQQEKSGELAAARAAELAKRVENGEDFAKAAKSLGLDVKASGSFSRTGSVADIGSGEQLESAFNTPIGKVGTPVQIAGNWVVFRVASRDEANPADLPKQLDSIKQQLLGDKQNAALAAFKQELEDRLTREGKLTINKDRLKQFTEASSS